jgi:hypothetical protein
MCWLAIVAFAIPTRTLPLRISRLNAGRATENIKPHDDVPEAPSLSRTGRQYIPNPREPRIQ